MRAATYAQQFNSRECQLSHPARFPVSASRLCECRSPHDRSTPKRPDNTKEVRHPETNRFLQPPVPKSFPATCLVWLLWPNFAVRQILNRWALIYKKQGTHSNPNQVFKGYLTLAVWDKQPWSCWFTQREERNPFNLHSHTLSFPCLILLYCNSRNFYY